MRLVILDKARGVELAERCANFPAVLDTDLSRDNDRATQRSIVVAVRSSIIGGGQLRDLWASFCWHLQPVAPRAPVPRDRWRIARLRSISAAARDLGLTPSGASARLAALERKLGARLLHRTTRQASLTEDGLALLPHAENVVLAAESARAALGREQAVPSCTLQLAAPASFTRMHIVPGLSDFCARYPGLALDLRIFDSVVDIVEGAFDVAVRYAELIGSSFVARRLAPDKRVLVASSDYLERRGRPTTSDDLAEHACRVVGTLDLWTFRGKDGAPIERRVIPTLRINDGGAVRDAACAGLGIALTAMWCAADELRSGAPVPALAEYPLISTETLWALYPSSRELAQKVRVFIDWLVERFGREPYWDRGLEKVLGTSQ